VRPLINGRELTLARLDEIAGRFEASLVSTAIRCVRLSDLPCAVAGIRDGIIACMFPSEALIKGGCYPGESKRLSSSAREQWERFSGGGQQRVSVDAKVGDWFQTFERDDRCDLYVTEQYLPVRSMDTLVVVLTIDEEDLFPDEEDEESDD
jgi:hypothetical protein